MNVHTRWLRGIALVVAHSGRDLVGPRREGVCQHPRRDFPGGEIRANLVTTPEPSSVVLVASGLVTFAGVGWSRRRAA